VALVESPPHRSGAVHLLSEKVDCAVVNAGDGSHDTDPGLARRLTIRRRRGQLGRLAVAICGDVLPGRWRAQAHRAVA
jgi:aspartate carbamoyltransferase catalytic subunit